MFGSEILDVLIGLAFLYLLLALICSVANEWVARIFALRSRTLEKGIRNLLRDGDLVAKVYDHPMVRGMRREKGKGESKPSYLASGTFTLTLFDTLMEAGGKDRGPSSSLQDEAEKAFKALEQGVRKIENNHAKRAMETILESVKSEAKEWDDALASARAAVENWFDDSMDRVSGWYKRQSQTIITVVALVVSIGVNADTIEVAEVLWRNKTVREAIVIAASNYVESGAKAEQDPSRSREGQPNDQPATGTAAVDPFEEMKSLRLPVGWGAFNRPDGAYGWMVKLVGWLLTATAASLGAPFWFDAVNEQAGESQRDREDARTQPYH